MGETGMRGQRPGNNGEDQREEWPTDAEIVAMTIRPGADYTKRTLDGLCRTTRGLLKGRTPEGVQRRSPDATAARLASYPRAMLCCCAQRANPGRAGPPQIASSNIWQ